MCYFSNSSFAGTFDVVVVNLYPFYSKVSSSSKISFEDGIENIDIGGSAMIRAAAKVSYFVLDFLNEKLWRSFKIMGIIFCVENQPILFFPKSWEL